MLFDLSSRIASIDYMCDHLKQRMYGQCFATKKIHDVIQHGCHYQCEASGKWRFVHQGILVITDSNVEVGITIMHE